MEEPALSLMACSRSWEGDGCPEAGRSHCRAGSAGEGCTWLSPTSWPEVYLVLLQEASVGIGALLAHACMKFITEMGQDLVGGLEREKAVKVPQLPILVCSALPTNRSREPACGRHREAGTYSEMLEGASRILFSRQLCRKTYGLCQGEGHQAAQREARGACREIFQALTSKAGMR